MAIQLKDQFILQVDLGGKQDFLSVQDFLAFEYYRKAGQCLPTMSLSFIVRDPSIVPYINSGNDITISLGRDSLSADTYTFSIFSDGSTRESEVGDKITIYGIAYKDSFSRSHGCQSYGYKNSLSVLKEVTSNYFNFVTNIDYSNDSQIWCRCGSPWDFCREVATSAFVDENTFIMSAFDCNNFYFYDVKRHLRESTPWVFYPSVISLDERSRIVNYIEATPINNSGVYNYLANYNGEAKVYRLLDDKYETVKPKLHNFTTLGKKVLNMSKNQTSKSYYLDCGNTHRNYNLARLQNIRSNIIYSSVNVAVRTMGFNKAINLLDTAILNEEGTQGRNDGYYFVSEISTKIVDLSVIMDVKLSRESPSYIKGNLVEG